MLSVIPFDNIQEKLKKIMLQMCRLTIFLPILHEMVKQTVILLIIYFKRQSGAQKNCLKMDILRRLTLFANDNLDSS